MRISKKIHVIQVQINRFCIIVIGSHDFMLPQSFFLRKILHRLLQLFSILYINVVLITERIRFHPNSNTFNGKSVTSTSNNKYLAISRRMIFQIQGRFSTAQRWLRLENLTQQLENQTSDMASYLLFVVLVQHCVYNGE